MAIGELTKQIAQQAILSATAKEPAPAPQPQGQAENSASVVLGQIAAMQKALKDDEELVVTFQSGGDRLRVMEIFTPSRNVVVLSGVDAERRGARAICGVEALALVCRVAKVPAGTKATRVGLVAPK
jgi:hypothetical protein